MKSSLTIATALLLAGVLAGCGSSPMSHPDGGAGHGGQGGQGGKGGKGGAAGTTVIHDGGPVDGGDGPPTSTCGMNGATQGQGETCGCDNECKTGHCVEGVCCETACTSGCQTCTAPDAGGLCVQRPAGATPRKPSDCTKDSQVTCGQDGFCDGAGKCRDYGATVTCQGGTCNGDSVVGAYACDGQGSCKPGVTLMFCLPYRCDSTSGTCFEDCTDQSQCDSQHSCDFSKSSCGQAGPGEPCKDDSGLHLRPLRRQGLLQHRLPGGLRRLQPPRPPRHLLADRLRQARPARRLQGPGGRELRPQRNLRRRRRLRELFARHAVPPALLHGQPPQHGGHLRRARHLPRAGRPGLPPLPLRRRRVHEVVQERRRLRHEQRLRQRHPAARSRPAPSAPRPRECASNFCVDGVCCDERLRRRLSVLRPADLARHAA